MQRYPQESQAGFSLIELMVVLVIVGFMAVLIPPRLGGVMETMQAKSSARSLISGLRETRSAAITQQKEFAFLIDIQENTFKSSGKELKRLPEKMVVKLYTASSEQVSEHIGGIRFFPDGSSTGGRIKLSSGNLNLYIDISWLTGKVALLDNVDPEQWESGDDGFAYL